MNRKRVSFILVFVFIFTFALFMNASADFKDDFSDTDYQSNGWYTILHLAKANIDYVYPARRRLSMQMPDSYTALYFVN